MNITDKAETRVPRLILKKHISFLLYRYSDNNYYYYYCKTRARRKQFLSLERFINVPRPYGASRLRLLQFTIQ